MAAQVGEDIFVLPAKVISRRASVEVGPGEDLVGRALAVGVEGWIDAGLVEGTIPEPCVAGQTLGF